VPRLAASRAGHKKGGEELGKGPEDIFGEGLCGVALGKGGDSLEAIPEILAGSTTGDQAWDAEVPQVPQATCLVEVLEERERAVACEKIHEVAGNGVHSIEVQIQVCSYGLLVLQCGPFRAVALQPCVALICNVFAAVATWCL
jgi:hypothetical protein